LYFFALYDDTCFSLYDEPRRKTRIKPLAWKLSRRTLPLRALARRRLIGLSIGLGQSLFTSLSIFMCSSELRFDVSWWGCRVFYLTVAEFFALDAGHGGGEEWGVGWYLFEGK
jgi:hypothetical protein